MATARLANVAVFTGLYAFAAGSVAFALFGSDARTSVGADSTIAPIFGAGVAAVAAVGTPAYGHLVTWFALLVGVVVTAMGLLRLGWVADFLPSPVVTGLLAGIGVEILVRQLASVTGIAASQTSTIGRLRGLWDHRSGLDWRTLLIAALVLAAVIGAERIDRRVPGPLIGLILSLAIVASFGLAAGSASHGTVKVVGAVHATFPTFGVPPASFADLRKLIGPVLTVAFVCLVQTAATERVSAEGSGSEPPTGATNQNLAAVGAGSLLAGLSGSFAVNASAPRTAAVANAGGRTQLTGLLAVAGALVVAAFGGPLLKDLPEATLGAILIFVATRLFHFDQMVAVWRYDRFEWALGLLTGGVVAIVGIEQGIVVAVVLALAQRIRLTARPRDSILGRVPGTDHWIPTDVGRTTEQVRGIVAYLVYSPIWYGNASFVRSRVLAAVGRKEYAPVHALVFDANGVADVDYTGATELRRLIENLTAQGISVYVARTSEEVHHDLRLAGLLAPLGVNHIHATVAGAVAAASAAIASESTGSTGSTGPAGSAGSTAATASEGATPPAAAPGPP